MEACCTNAGGACMRASWRPSSLYGDRIVEHIERLAHHAVRGEIWDKAVSYCYQAGAKAAAKSAHREAVARFAEALAAIERLPQSGAVMQQAIDLRFSLRTSLSPLGEFQRSFELLHEAEAIATTLNRQARLARVFTFKALYFWWDRPTGSRHRRRRTGIGYRADGWRDAGAGTGKALRRPCATCEGRLPAGDELLNWVVAATDADRTNFLGMANLPSVSARTWLSWSLAELGEFVPALMRGDEGVCIAEAVDDLVSRIYAYMALGIVHLRRGDLVMAISRLQRAFEMSASGNLHMARVTVAGYLGRAWTLSTRAGDAIAILEEAIDAASSMELMVDQTMRYVHLSDAYLHAGQLERATSVAHLALQTAVDYHQSGSVAWSHWLFGEIHSRASDAETAEGHYTKAMELASEPDGPPARSLPPRHRQCIRSSQESRAGPQPSRKRDHVVRMLDTPSWLHEAEVSLQRLQTR